MKCNPLRWLWGVPAILGLTFAATHFMHRSIEDDLTRRVETQLQGSNLRWAKSGFSGRDGVITGKATDESDPLKAIGLASKTWGVRTVENRTELIEKADAFSWWATRTGNRVVLRGLVPSENTKTAIAGVARTEFPGAEIVDETRLARGVPSPDTWLSGVTFGLKQLKGLKSGEARLDGLNLAVSGEAASLEGFRGAKTAFASNLPNGIRLTDDRITPPVVKPYLWAAQRAGNRVTLTGYVPNERVRSDVLAAARQSFTGADVVDRMELADGAPSGFLTVATGSLKDLMRLENGSAALNDTRLTVAGLAADEAAASNTRRSLRAAVPQSFRLVDEIKYREPQAPLAVSPYTAAADVQTGRVVLTGYAPSDAARDAIEQAARNRFPGRTIDNRMVVGPGAPEGWNRCLDAGFLGMARLGGDRMTVSDRRLEVMGRTDDEDLAAAVPGDVRSATQGACDASVRVELLQPQEPDITWRATYDGRDMVLSGEVISEAVRASLLQQAQRQVQNGRVIDQMRITPNRSKQWPRTAEAGLRALAGLRSGEAVLARRDLTVRGEAPDQPTYSAARERATRDLGAGYTGREQITLYQPPAPPPAPRIDTQAQACQDGLREAARLGNIEFNRAQATLTAGSATTLDRLAQIARTCPRVIIEIEGHTDAEGTPERNQRLSDRRATAVVEYLVKAGVETEKLRAAGYGETRPIAPNDTPANRARNRRIEFTVHE